jgi:hypothetical protein
MVFARGNGFLHALVLFQKFPETIFEKVLASATRQHTSPRFLLVPRTAGCVLPFSLLRDQGSLLWSCIWRKYGPRAVGLMRFNLREPDFSQESR